jgi:hypothetical protein
MPSFVEAVVNSVVTLRWSVVVTRLKIGQRTVFWQALDEPRLP